MKAQRNASVRCERSHQAQREPDREPWNQLLPIEDLEP
jgi:hypothetical protein